MVFFMVQLMKLGICVNALRVCILGFFYELHTLWMCIWSALCVSLFVVAAHEIFYCPRFDFTSSRKAIPLPHDLKLQIAHSERRLRLLIIEHSFPNAHMHTHSAHAHAYKYIYEMHFILYTTWSFYNIHNSEYIHVCKTSSAPLTLCAIEWERHLQTKFHTRINIT